VVGPVETVGGVVQARTMPDTAWTSVPSSVGELTLQADGDGLRYLLFDSFQGRPSPVLERVRSGPRIDDHAVLVTAAAQLAEYFAGARQRFELPLAPRGSAFQQAVWEQLRSIPYGAMVSYGDIARRLGLAPGASRAIGLANGSNPIAVIIPCHRVIGADGSLTGFGGGLDRKRTLLDLESGVVGDRLF